MIDKDGLKNTTERERDVRNDTRMDTTMRWIALTIAVALCLVWVVTIPNEPVSDQGIYNTAAERLASGAGYTDDSGNPTAYWAPGYTFYIASFYYLFGSKVTVAFAANFISYLFLVAGVYTLSCLAYSRRVGAMAAILTALYPSFIFYTTIIASETLFSAMLIWVLVFGWLSFQKDRYKILWIVACGILLGLTALVRPQALLIPIALFAIGSAQHASIWSASWRFITVAILMVITCIPWGLRNQEQLGAFVLVSANSGANLWIGNHEGADGGYMHLDSAIANNNLENASLVERDKQLSRKALQFIKENPGQFARLMLQRIYITMKSESIAAVWNEEGIKQRFGQESVILFKIAANAAYFLLLVFFLYYLFFSLKKGTYHSSDALLWTMLILLSVPFLIFMGQDRFHLPLIPYLIIFVSKAYHTKVPHCQRP
ncbi:MAG: glycosyltransferase family 39 protein [Chlamydiales bacterium]|nr:glycosyltransferase family 39 protein [Chlamydiia bacterium]MCP5508733.1 glycosyltransferase family 39 protein [Chlamydiales bacterium]